MRKRLYLMHLVLLSAAIVACGSKYDDAASTLNDYADAMEAFATRMGAADSSDAVVQAMNAYTQQLETLAPRIQAMHQQFPELASGKTYPAELEKVSRRMAELSPRIQSAMMKTVTYMMDPQVQQAMAAQAQAMAQTGQ